MALDVLARAGLALALLGMQGMQHAVAQALPPALAPALPPKPAAAAAVPSPSPAPAPKPAAVPSPSPAALPIPPAPAPTPLPALSFPPAQPPFAPAPAPALPATGPGELFNVTLTPGQVVPPVANSGAWGYALLDFRPEAILFELWLFNIAAPRTARLNIGIPGDNGPVVATLWKPTQDPAPNTLAAPGLVGKGTIANVDFVGPWELPYNQHLTSGDLFGRYAGPGDTYVVVTTLQHGVNGEIRGQVTADALVPNFSLASLPPEELPAGI